jgi:hypothetical protein
MDPENEAISRTIALTAEDVVAANRLWTNRYRRTRSALLGPVIAGIAVCILYLEPRAAYWGLFRAATAGVLAIIASFLLIWIYYLVAVPIAGRRAWQARAGLQKPTDYLLTPKRLSYVQEEDSAQLAWRSLVRWSADERCLILYNTRITFYILPRRLFSDEEVARIEGWLTGSGVPRY